MTVLGKRERDASIARHVASVLHIGEDEAWDLLEPYPGLEGDGPTDLSCPHCGYPLERVWCDVEAVQWYLVKADRLEPHGRDEWSESGPCCPQCDKSVLEYLKEKGVL